MPSPLLELSHFGFAYDTRTVVRELNLSLGSVGLFTLMGPAGTGKSSLLRLLAGVQPPSLRTWGEVRYQGAPLGADARPTLVEQKARALLSSLSEGILAAIPERSSLSRADQRDRVHALLAELGLDVLQGSLDAPVVEMPTALQRCASLARAYASGAALLCVDEPCAGLSDRARGPVLGALARMAERRSVLLVTHDRREPLALGGDVGLLAGGALHETAPACFFFTDPSTAAGQQYVRTGGCSLPSPDALPEELDEDFVPAVLHSSAGAPATLVVHWVLPGALAGFRRPGLLGDARAELAVLARAGIRVLVCLEESPTVSPDDARAAGLTLAHHPVADMDAPSFEAARALCLELDGYASRGVPVGVHCRAGLGRTGTALASYLAWRGRTGPQALAEVRRVDPRFVQSERQLEFIARFAERCAADRG